MKNTQSNHGILVVFEGIDGSGKTTLTQALAVALRNHHKDVVLTREPGATALGRTIRETILKHGTVTGRAEFLLFAADRAQHIVEIVAPALMRGSIVLSDRMADSSVVYQGTLHNLDPEAMTYINRWAMNGIKPDLTIYLKVSPELAHHRLVARGPLTKFETSSMLQDAANAFDRLYQDRDDVLTLDATRSTPELTQAIIEELKRRFGFDL